MPVFSNFMKLRPTNSDSPSADKPIGPEPPKIYESRKHRDKHRRDKDKHHRSHHHKHKSRHHRDKRDKNGSSSSEDELLPLPPGYESKKAQIMKEELQMDGQSSKTFSIRRLGDHTSYKNRGIHKLDRPDYYKAYLGALGTNHKLYFSWSPDLRTFELWSKPPSRELDESQNRKRRLFEGRYCAKGAVSSIGRPVRKKTVSELDAEIMAHGSDIIPLPNGAENLDVDSNVDLKEQEAMERRFMEKNKELNSAVTDDPHNVELWLKLIKLQDEFASLASGSYRKHFAGAGGHSKAILERQMDMFTKALDYNPDNIKLILSRFETLERLQDAKQVNAEWAKQVALRTDSAPLWLAYLRFIQSNFTHFSISHFRTVYSSALRYLNRVKLKFSDSLLAFEGCLAEILVCAATVEYQSGYRERAIAIHQATLEINFFPPEMITAAFHRVDIQRDSSSLSAARYLLVSTFKAFWESGLPRFAETGAKGWRAEFDAHDALKPSIEIYDPLQEAEENNPFAIGNLEAMPSTQNNNLTSSYIVSDSSNETEISSLSASGSPHARLLSSWIRAEREKDAANLLPLRPEQMVDDADAVVLFEDLKDLLIHFSHPEAKNFILTSFFELLGVYFKPFQPTQGALIQSRILDSENLDDIFFIIDPVCPEMASVSYSEGELPTGSLPSMVDFLDSYLAPATQESTKKEILRSALLQAESMALSVERLAEIKTCRVLLDGESMAKSLLQNDSESVILWNAYVKLLTAHSASDKSTFIRRTYTSIIKTLLQNPLIMETVVRTVEWEIRHGETDKALEALLLIAESEKPSASLSLEDRLNHATLHYNHRFATFSSGIAQSILADPLSAGSSSLISESLDVFFHLAIASALCEGLVRGINSLTSVFIAARGIFTNFAELGPSLHSRTRWYIERLWIHQLGYLSLEYERKNSQVPMGILRSELLVALETFPSNVYFLSLFVVVAQRSNLIAYSRRYFDMVLLSNSKAMEDGTHRLLSWLFSARSEVQKGAHPRIIRQLERSVQFESKYDAHLPQSPLIWKLWLEAELRAGKFKSAKNLLFRAIQSCPWSKSLWLEFINSLSRHFSPNEIQTITSLMETKEIRLHSLPSL